MSFTIADYVVIGIVALAAIIGLAKGFIKMLFSLCKGVITFVGAFLLCKPIANFAQGLSFAGTINDKILTWVNGKGDVFTQPITEGAGDLVAENLGLPSFISDYIAKVLNSALTDLVGTSATLGEAVAQTLTYYVLIILSFILLLIVLGILVKILSKLFTKLFDAPILKPINKLLGLVLGAALGVIVVCVLFLGANALSSFVSPISDFITTQIDPTNESFGVARWLYNNNVINWAIDKLASSGSIDFSGITGK